ncbi:KGK domain-containing protein [Calothrix sp. 336/3]|uniref:KGK domain-containing protein n=1 Tax=Calothrix sp. 336/3 TaxID=1337936 RepID=UPI000551F280|nr:KGK domain-containing protein [Calothrix sp. 336/3]
MKQIILNDDDVFSTDEETSFFDQWTMRVSVFKSNMKDWVQEKVSSDQEDWVCEGVEAEILQSVGGGWKKGRVKIRLELEFIPDDPLIENTEEDDLQAPPSPLDDFRKA